MNDAPRKPCVRIYALGEFAIQREGFPVQRHIRPSRPLALLKCLLSCGRAGGLRHRVTDWLWPHVEDDAHGALEINVHRLRNLLGHRDTVILGNGLLRLNPDRVWVDAMAFEDAAARFDRARPVFDDALAAMFLYRGSFLEHEEDHPWILHQRARLHARFVSIAERFARTLQPRADDETALEVYRIAVSRDPLNEALNQGLIDTLERIGRRTEARQAFDRFSALTRKSFGWAPSERMRQGVARLVDATSRLHA